MHLLILRDLQYRRWRVGTTVVLLSLAGRDLAQYHRSTIGIVFQGFNLIPSLSARENVAAPLLVAGVKRKVALQRASDLLEEVGLSDRADHKPIQLSGGEQLRVDVARGLVGDPMVLLADEPTANLDRASEESIVELVRQLRSRGRTIIISTHDERLLPAMDQVVAMSSDQNGCTHDVADIDLLRDHTTFQPGKEGDYVATSAVS